MEKLAAHKAVNGGYRIVFGNALPIEIADMHRRECAAHPNNHVTINMRVRGERRFGPFSVATVELTVMVNYTAERFYTVINPAII